MVLLKETKYIEVHKIKIQRPRNCCKKSHLNIRHLPKGTTIYKYRFGYQNWSYNNCTQCFIDDMTNIEIDTHKVLEQLK